MESRSGGGTGQEVHTSLSEGGHLHLMHVAHGASLLIPHPHSLDSGLTPPEAAYSRWCSDLHAPPHVISLTLQTQGGSHVYTCQMHRPGSVSIYEIKDETR